MTRMSELSRSAGVGGNDHRPSWLSRDGGARDQVTAADMERAVMWFVLFIFSLPFIPALIGLLFIGGF